MKRRNFLKNSSAATAGLISTTLLGSCKEEKAVPVLNNENAEVVRPIVICTWNFLNASAKAWEVLQAGGTSLDAIEQGVMI